MSQYLIVRGAEWEKDRSRMSAVIIHLNYGPPMFLIAFRECSRFAQNFSPFPSSSWAFRDCNSTRWNRTWKYCLHHRICSIASSKNSSIDSQIKNALHFIKPSRKKISKVQLSHCRRCGETKSGRVKQKQKTSSSATNSSSEDAAFRVINYICWSDSK